MALKALMAVSGLIMIGFLLAHMYGNLKVFAGPAAFDEYAHHLRTIGEPILPYGGALWIIRVVLLAAIIAHVYSAATPVAPDSAGARRRVTDQALPEHQGPARGAADVRLVHHALGRGDRAVVPDLPPGGVHLGLDPSGRRLGQSRTSGWSTASTSGGWSLLYTIALIAVGFHLRHGTWGAMMTLGANTSSVARRRLNLLAYAVALIIVIGFLLPPYSILFGLVG